MDDYKVKYQHIKSDYESYQKIAEDKIQELSTINRYAFKCYINK